MVLLLVIALTYGGATLQRYPAAFNAPSRKNVHGLFELV
jgi:hypothetical protein